MTYRLPCDLWGWRGTSLVLIGLSSPPAAMVTLDRADNWFQTIAAATLIFVGSSALATAGLLLAQGRLAGNDQGRRLSIGLVVLAMAALTRGGHALTDPGSARLGTGTAVVMSGLMLALVGLVVLAIRRTTLPGWARVRFTAAAELIALCVAVGALPPQHPVGVSTALALGVVGGVLLTDTGAALLRQAVIEEQDHISELQGRLADIEAAQRADLARMHEINTLVAGIASASHLVRQIPPSDSREQLQRMIDAELDRLQRMLDDRAGRSAPPDATRRAGATEQVDLGELVQRIAWVHRARGHQVTSVPTQVRVPGDADAVAEVLDALVENAALHGSPEDLTIVVAKVGDGVEIAVSDRGPGVTALVQDTLFAWGAHRPGSPGRGIGLYAAQERARRLGGTLRLEESRAGARFVLHLPDRTDRTEGVRTHDHFAGVAS